jgi:hypothetical protein
MISPQYLERIKNQAVALINIIKVTENNSINNHKEIVSRILCEQTILGLEMAIKVFNVYGSIHVSPMMDEINGLKRDLILFQKGL